MSFKGAKGKSSRVVVWVILALLIVGLAGFGATNFGGGVRQIGKVGDIEISVDDYARALQQELQQLSQQTGQNVTLAQARLFGIDRAVLQQLVGRAALDNETQIIGLSVGDAQVAQEIRVIPAFQGLNGEFDRESYQFVLERNGLTPARFEEQVRIDTARNILQGAVSGGVSFPKVYTDTLYAHAREARDVTWAQLTVADLDQEFPVPTEAQLAAYHTEHPDLFTSPEARVVTYAWLTPDMLAGYIKSDDATLRAIYQERIDEFVQPERRLVERLVFGNEADAQTAADAIAAGETDFDTLVVERNLSLDDIDLGDVSREDLGDAADAVFALDEPGVAGPAPSNLGPALYRVNAILSASEVSFEDAREDLALEVEADQARRMIEDLEPEIEDLLAGGATLEDLADQTEMELGTISVERDSADGPAAYDAFRAEAMAATEDDFPELRRLDDGGIFALRLDEIRPPELIPLDQVREQVTDAWRRDEIRAALTTRAEALAEEIANGASFEDVGLVTGTATGVRRDGFIEGIAPDAIPTLFGMEVGAAGAVPTITGVAIARLDAITPADQNSEEAVSAKAIFAGQSAAAMAEDILTSFVRAAELDAGISIDQTAIDAVHTQLP